MPIVAFSTVHDGGSWLRQTRRGDGVWGDWTFRVNGDAAGADWLVVYDDVPAPIISDLPRERRILVVTEPPGIKVYRSGFMRQFGVMLSPMAVPGFDGRYVETDVGLPWMIGLDMTSPLRPMPSRWDWDGFANLPVGDKQHRMSAVISTKAILPRHRKRVEFVRELADRLGDRFHLYGRGFREIDDKAEAILPYSHHLVIENNAEDGFFTEKITDAYLGWSLPIFSGCDDIEKYFPAHSMIRFDLDAPDAIERVIAALDTPVDAARLAAMAEARVAVMERANLFARLADVLGRLDSATPRGARVPVRPNEDFLPLRRRLSRAFRRFRRRLFPR